MAENNNNKPKLPRISKRMHCVLLATVKTAIAMRHEYILTEHLLLNLLKIQDIQMVLTSIGCDHQALNSYVANYLKTNIEQMSVFRNSDDDKIQIIPPNQSLAFSRIIDGAFSQALASQKRTVTVFDVLLALIANGEGYGAYLMHEFNVDRFSLITEVTEFYSHDNNDQLDDFIDEDEEQLLQSNAFLSVDDEDDELPFSVDNIKVKYVKFSNNMKDGNDEDNDSSEMFFSMESGNDLDFDSDEDSDEDENQFLEFNEFDDDESDNDSKDNFSPFREFIDEDRQVDDSDFKTNTDTERELKKKKSKQELLLEKYGVDLIDYAKNGHVDNLIGRQTEVNRMMQILCRRKKNNPILVGEPGVGKTAIAEGLALAIADGEVPEKLQESRIWSIDMSSVVAGTKYRGEFEKRLKKIIDALKDEPNSIIFVDEIHTLMGAGASGDGSLDASNILKPVLNKGQLRCIGTTTYDDYKKHILKDKAFSRRLQKIDITEPSIDETIQIVNGVKNYYEDHYNVTYSKNAIETAVKLSALYINERFLPDKAIDVIDEVGARNDLRGVKRRKKMLNVTDVEEVVASMANIPTAKVSSSDSDVLLNLEKDLNNVVFGQKGAVNDVVKAIKISRSGIGAKDKPIGSFLFCGPTGVGKTELAKQLAAKLGVNFIRFDMSEYAEKHTISKLIGSPPGYVGFEQAGLLTEALIKNPHSIVLIDEIEKAHSDIYNVLLQVMDYGFLTDNSGRKADFRNAICIMTSNVGARALDINRIGFGDKLQGVDVEDKKLTTNKEVEKFFTPEFRNRLDSIIYFNSLSIELMQQIVRKFVGQLADDLKTKKVQLAITDSAIDYFIKEGFDPKMGARPLQRIIRNKLQEQLANEILFGELTKGGFVNVTFNNKVKQLELDITANRNSK
ncbi:AAA family ATPase [Lentisphaerota bacterium WC36G]|nr:AAA family ATPase [Lentisphaerae bacterium WC36]